MQAPVEFLDRSEYAAAMNARLELDPRRTAVLTVDMQRDYLDMQVASAPVAYERTARRRRSVLEGRDRVHPY